MTINRKFVVSRHRLLGFYWCAECGCLSAQWLGIIVEFDYDWLW